MPCQGDVVWSELVGLYPSRGDLHGSKISTGNKGVGQLLSKFFNKCGITYLLFLLLMAHIIMSGCIEKTEISRTGTAKVQLAEDSPLQLHVDFDADVSCNLFRVRGSLMFAGNSSFPYLLLNATLRQGDKAIGSTKFLFIQTKPDEDLSFEISKNMKIPRGRYNCTLEVVGPGGLLDCESRECGLAEPWEEAMLPASTIPSERLATKTAEQLLQEFMSNQDDAVSKRDSAASKQDDAQSNQDDAREGEAAANREEAMKNKIYASDRNDDISSVSSEDAVLKESSEELVSSSPDVFANPDLDNDSSEQLGVKSNPSSGISAKQDGRFVGSVTSKKYHRPDCRYALKIKPDNRIYFDSVEDARSQGYLPCKTCNP